MPTKTCQVLCIIGTRPEIIKMAPIIFQLKKHKQVHVTIINTAQHRELIDDVLMLFNIQPDIDMNIMQANQSLENLTGNLFIKIGQIIAGKKYDVVIAQGDTTTTLVASQVAFYHHIPFAHVEAGLRTNDFRNPFPEEMNRVLISKMATLHFAPTDIEKNNLLKEGIPEEDIFVTGNTIIDSLYFWANQKVTLPFKLPEDKKIILLTLHRRESFGEPLREMFSAFIELTKKFKDIHIIYPVHPNPNVKLLANEMLSHNDAITLLQPIRYDILVQLLKRSFLVCTDSGGLQEEAPALNIPLLVLREETERPLIIQLGLAKLAGTSKSSVVAIMTDVLTHPNVYNDMKKNISPYGDGHAANRIVDVVIKKLIKH